MISQQELIRYQELQQLAAECQSLRVSLRDKLLAGAVVESGAGTASLRSVERRPATWPVLRGLLGDEEVERLRALVPVDEQHQLFVRFPE